MTALECSSRGDMRFSAFYARVKAFGVEDSIENHYQRAKRWRSSTQPNNPKGKRPDYVAIRGRVLPAGLLSAWYVLLWVKYLDQHPELVEYASHFDTFTDMFRGRSINCQAYAIRAYVKDGRDSILSREDVIVLLGELSKIEG